MCDKHEFFFEFDKAFTAQLVDKFEASPAHRLSQDIAPPNKGVYALYRHGKIVYAGKALDTTLRRRLGEHTRKISGRANIELREVACRFLIIDCGWFVRVRELALIGTCDPVWNLSGFGTDDSDGALKRRRSQSSRRKQGAGSAVSL